MLKHFVAIYTTLLRQLLRPELGKLLGMSTLTSQQVQMEFLLWKNGKYFLLPGISFGKILPVSHTKFVQFVQSQNIVKMCLVFPTSQNYQVSV